MRPIHLVHLEVLRPVLVLTREAVRGALPTVTVAPISDEFKGLSSELRLGPENGLEFASVAQLDEIMTLPAGLLAERIGVLLPAQEQALARAMVLAFDLDVPLYG